MRELLRRPAHELLDLVEAGDVNHLELYEAQCQFAEEANTRVNAYCAFSNSDPREPARFMAQEGPRQYRWLPYAAKDLFCTHGLHSTAGSMILQGYEPPYDATAVRLLNEGGAHLLGKLNMDEFAMGSSGETCAWGRTRNPWNEDYVPGGSSSGSAAAVAACMSPMSLGTDTGGSVRQPASLCGVTGYRPTYGLISRYGMIAYSSSCDQCGVFARDALDCALAMNTLSLPDEMDSTCVAKDGIDYYAEAERAVHWEKLRVGVLRPFVDAASITPEVLSCYRQSLQRIENAGATTVEFDFPLAEACLPAYYIITAAECSSNLARYDGIRFGPPPTDADLLERYVELRSRGFGPEVKRRILLGTYVLSAGYAGKFYDNARRLRRAIASFFADLFQKVDVIAVPTSASLAFRFGERSADPVAMYMSDLCTVFVNLAGLCGISLPCGMAHDQHGIELPVGLQFACAGFHDTLLLRLAWQYQQLVSYRYTPPQWVQDALGG